MSLSKENLWKVGNLNRHRLDESIAGVSEEEKKKIWDLKRRLEKTSKSNGERIFSLPDVDKILGDFGAVSTKALFVVNDIVKESLRRLDLLPLEWRRVANTSSPLPGDAITFKPTFGKMRYFCRVEVSRRGVEPSPKVPELPGLPQLPPLPQVPPGVMVGKRRRRSPQEETKDDQEEEGISKEETNSEEEAKREDEHDSDEDGGHGSTKAQKIHSSRLKEIPPWGHVGSGPFLCKLPKMLLKSMVFYKIFQCLSS